MSGLSLRATALSLACVVILALPADAAPRGGGGGGHGGGGGISRGGGGGGGGIARGGGGGGAHFSAPAARSFGGGGGGARFSAPAVRSFGGGGGALSPDRASAAGAASAALSGAHVLASHDRQPQLLASGGQRVASHLFAAHAGRHSHVPRQSRRRTFGIEQPVRPGWARARCRTAGHSPTVVSAARASLADRRLGGRASLADRRLGDRASLADRRFGANANRVRRRSIDPVASPRLSHSTARTGTAIGAGIGPPISDGSDRCSGPMPMTISSTTPSGATAGTERTTTTTIRSGPMATATSMAACSRPTATTISPAGRRRPPRASPAARAVRPRLAARGGDRGVTTGSLPSSQSLGADVR